jgi:nucleotide-binding universal stress UspA family protein
MSVNAYFFGDLSVLLKKVLVAIDGSENSGRALDFAVGISEKFGSSLSILNVSESISLNPSAAETMTSSSGSMAAVAVDVSKIHEGVLSKAVARAKAAVPDLEVSSLQRQGDAAAEIVNVAKEGGFDVVVLGSKGLGKVKAFFMGSVSSKVAHLAPCPVVIVK